MTSGAPGAMVDFELAAGPSWITGSFRHSLKQGGVNTREGGSLDVMTLMARATIGVTVNFNDELRPREDSRLVKFIPGIRFELVYQQGGIYSMEFHGTGETALNFFGGHISFGLGGTLTF